MEQDDAVQAIRFEKLASETSYSSITMDVLMKKNLKKNGVDDETISILEDQQLFDCESIGQIDTLILFICGIKAGQVIKVKNACKNIPTNDNNITLDDGSCSDQSEEFLPFSELEKKNEIDGDANIDAPTTSVVALETKPSTRSQCPLVMKSTVFKFEKKENNNLFDNFTLSEIKFSPAVSQGLKSKRLTGPLRCEFVRAICTNIFAKGVHFINRKERETVAVEIIMKYPHLKDKIGSGLASWSLSIKNRFSHVRKYDTKKRKRADAAVISSCIANEKAKAKKKKIGS